MGKVNQLSQDEREKRWHQHYDDFLNAIPESDRTVIIVDAANRYADDMMEEEDAKSHAEDAPS